MTAAATVTATTAAAAAPVHSPWGAHHAQPWSAMAVALEIPLQAGAVCSEIHGKVPR